MENFSLSRIGNYQLTHRRLGKGAFAKVYEARHRQLNVKVALKAVNLRALDDRYMKKWFKREAELLSQLNHPGIVALFEVMESQSHFYMVLEYAGQNLCDFVRAQNRGRVDELLARNFARQLVAAVAYMHSKQIIHRDIKLENVLVNIRTKRVKLSDFGLSRSWDRINALTTNCGSPEYASPELHAGKSYGSKVDIWALGVVFFGMVVGRLPFEVNTKKPVSTQVQRKLFLDETRLGVKTMKHQSFMGSASYLIKNLLSKMLHPEPQQRFSIGQVGDHAWIRGWQAETFMPLDEKSKSEIIQKCFVDHHKTTDIHKVIDESPFGPIGGVFNIQKHLYQSIKLSQTYRKVCEIKPLDAAASFTAEGRNVQHRPTTARGYHHESFKPRDLIRPNTSNCNFNNMRTNHQSLNFSDNYHV